MYQDVSPTPIVIIYFLLLVVICSMFVLNLTIAVMLIAFIEKTDENEEENGNEDLENHGL
jgi:hypothetical protein